MASRRSHPNALFHFAFSVGLSVFGAAAYAQSSDSPPPPPPPPPPSPAHATTTSTAPANTPAVQDDYCQQPNIPELAQRPLLAPKSVELHFQQTSEGGYFWSEPFENSLQEKRDPVHQAVLDLEMRKLNRQSPSQTGLDPRSITYAHLVNEDNFSYFSERALRCKVKAEEGKPVPYADRFQAYVTNELIPAVFSTDPPGQKAVLACNSTTNDLFAIKDKEILTAIADQIHAEQEFPKERSKPGAMVGEPGPTDSLLKIVDRIRRKQKSIQDSQRTATKADPLNADEIHFLNLLFKDSQTPCSGFDTFFGTGLSAYLRDYILDKRPLLETQPAACKDVHADMANPTSDLYLFKQMPFADKPSLKDFRERLRVLLHAVTISDVHSPANALELSTYPLNPASLSDLTVDEQKTLQAWLGNQIGKLECLPPENKPWEAKDTAQHLKWWARYLLKEILERSVLAIDNNIRTLLAAKKILDEAQRERAEGKPGSQAKLDAATEAYEELRYQKRMTPRRDFHDQAVQRQEREISASPLFASDQERLTNLRHNLNNFFKEDLNTDERVAFSMADPLHQALISRIAYNLSHEKWEVQQKKPGAHRTLEQIEKDQKELLVAVRNLSGSNLINLISTNPVFRKAFAETMASNIEGDVAHRGSTVRAQFREFFSRQLSDDPAFNAAIVEELCLHSPPAREKLNTLLATVSQFAKLCTAEESPERLVTLTSVLKANQDLRQKLAQLLASELDQEEARNPSVVAFYQLLAQPSEASSRNRVTAIRRHLAGTPDEAFRVWTGDMSLQINNSQDSATAQKRVTDLKARLESLPEGEERKQTKKELDEATKNLDAATRARSAFSWTMSLIDRLGNNPQAVARTYKDKDPFSIPAFQAQQLLEERKAILDAAVARIPSRTAVLYQQKLQTAGPNADRAKLFEEAKAEATAEAPSLIVQDINAARTALSLLHQVPCPSVPNPNAEQAEEKKNCEETKAAESHLIDEYGAIGLPSSARIALSKEPPELSMLRQHGVENVYVQLQNDVRAGHARDQAVKTRIHQYIDPSLPVEKDQTRDNIAHGVRQLSEQLLEPDKAWDASRIGDPAYYDYLIDHGQRDRLREKIIYELITSPDSTLSETGKLNLQLLTLAERWRRDGKLNRLVTPADIGPLKDEQDFKTDVQRLESELRLLCADRLEAAKDKEGAKIVLSKIPGVTLDLALAMYEQEQQLRRQIFSPAELAKFLAERKKLLNIPENTAVTNPVILLPPSHLARTLEDDKVQEERRKAHEAGMKTLVEDYDQLIGIQNQIRQLDKTISSLSGPMLQKVKEKSEELLEGKITEDEFAQFGRSNGPLLAAIQSRAGYAKTEREILARIEKSKASNRQAGVLFDASTAQSNQAYFSAQNDEEWTGIADDYVTHHLQDRVDKFPEAQRADLRENLVQQVKRILLHFQEGQERPTELAAAVQRQVEPGKPVNWNSQTHLPLYLDYLTYETTGTHPQFQRAEADKALTDSLNVAQAKGKQEAETVSKDKEELRHLGIEIINGVMVTNNAHWERVTENSNGWHGGLDHLKEVMLQLGQHGIRYDMVPEQSPWFGFNTFLAEEFNRADQIPRFEISAHSSAEVVKDPVTQALTFKFFNLDSQRRMGDAGARAVVQSREEALRKNAEYRREGVWNPLPLLGDYFVNEARGLKSYVADVDEREEEVDRRRAYNITMRDIARLQAMGNTMVTDPDYHERVPANKLAEKYLQWMSTKYLADDQKTIDHRKAWDYAGIELAGTLYTLPLGMLGTAKLAASNVVWAQRLMAAGEAIKDQALLGAVLPAGFMGVTYGIQNFVVLPQKYKEAVAKYEANGNQPLDGLPYLFDRNMDGKPDENYPWLIPRADEWAPTMSRGALTGAAFSSLSVLQAGKVHTLGTTAGNMFAINASQRLVFNTLLRETNPIDEIWSAGYDTLWQLPGLRMNQAATRGYGLPVFQNNPRLTKAVAPYVFAATNTAGDLARAAWNGAQLPEDPSQWALTIATQLSQHLTYGYMMSRHLESQMAAQEILRTFAPQPGRTGSTLPAVPVNYELRMQEIVKKYGETNVNQALMMIPLGSLKPEAPNSPRNGTVALVEKDPHLAAYRDPTPQDPIFQRLAAMTGLEPWQLRFLLARRQQGMIFEGTPTLADIENAAPPGDSAGSLPRPPTRALAAPASGPSNGASAGVVEEPRNVVLWGDRDVRSGSASGLKSTLAEKWAAIKDALNKPRTGFWAPYEGPLRWRNQSDPRPITAGDPEPSPTFRAAQNLYDIATSRGRENESAYSATREAATGLYKLVREQYVNGKVPARVFLRYPGALGTLQEKEVKFSDRELTTILEAMMTATYKAEKQARNAERDRLFIRRVRTQPEKVTKEEDNFGKWFMVYLENRRRHHPNDQTSLQQEYLDFAGGIWRGGHLASFSAKVDRDLISKYFSNP